MENLSSTAHQATKTKFELTAERTSYQWNTDSIATQPIRLPTIYLSLLDGTESVKRFLSQMKLI